jgi:GNAT superfamily N-acetyltransferase
VIKDDIKIETASVDDAETVLCIQKKAFLEQAEIYNDYQLPPLTQSLDSIEEEFKSKTFLKAVLNNQIIASTRFSVTDGYVDIDRLVVDPHYQNQGIGMLLLKEVERIALGATALRLFTGNKSKRNLHLYNKLGFCKVREDMTDQGITLVYLEKKL